MQFFADSIAGRWNLLWLIRDDRTSLQFRTSALMKPAGGKCMTGMTPKGFWFFRYHFRINGQLGAGIHCTKLWPGSTVRLHE